MNRPIRRVAFVAMIMFALLLANGTYMMIFRESSLEANAQNRRVRDEQFAQNRGSILAAGKTEIAKTDPTKDRFKYQRVYPNGRLYAPITGFYSYDHGSTGLESTYNSQLAGTDDALFVRRLVDMATDRTPQGASVQSTIVPAVQEAATEALGDQKGAVVALDPKTGALLALVTSPGTTRPSWPATRSRTPARPTPGWPRMTSVRWRTGRLGRSIRPAPPSSWSPRPRRWPTARARTAGSHPPTG